MTIENDKALLDGIINKATKSPDYDCHVECRDDGWYAVAVPHSKRDLVREQFIGGDLADALLTMDAKGFQVDEFLIVNALKRRIRKNEHSYTY